MDTSYITKVDFRKYFDTEELMHKFIINYFRKQYEKRGYRQMSKLIPIEPLIKMLRNGTRPDKISIYKLIGTNYVYQDQSFVYNEMDDSYDTTNSSYDTLFKLMSDQPVNQLLDIRFKLETALNVNEREFISSIHKTWFPDAVYVKPVSNGLYFYDADKVDSGKLKTTQPNSKQKFDTKHWILIQNKIFKLDDLLEIDESEYAKFNKE